MLCQIGTVSQQHLPEDQIAWLDANTDSAEDFVSITDGDSSQPREIDCEIVPAAEVVAGQHQDEWICFDNDHSQAAALKSRAAEIHKGFWTGETMILIDDDYLMD